MKSVTIHKNANEIIEIVRDLRARGLVQGLDFDFSYGYTDAGTSCGVFRFHTDRGQRYSTFFTLGWAN